MLDFEIEYHKDCLPYVTTPLCNFKVIEDRDRD